MMDPTKPKMNYPAPPMPPSGAPTGAALPPPQSAGPAVGSQTYGGVLQQPSSMLPTSLAPNPVTPGPGQPNSAGGAIPPGTTPDDLLKALMSGIGGNGPAISGPPGIR